MKRIQRLYIYFFIGIIIFVLFVGRGSAEDSFPVIPKVSQGPIIDGDISDTVWNQGLIVQLSYADADREGEPENPTTVYTLTDNENIYFAFKCIETHPEGPFVADPTHVLPGNIPLDVSDFVRVRISFGRWGRYAYYLLESNTTNTSYCSDYRVFDTWRSIVVPGSAQLTSYKSQSKISPGYWSAEIKVAINEILLYPGEGIPKNMELEFYRERIGNDRTKNFEDIIIFDERPAYWKSFYNYVQSWTRMPNPHRFLAEIYKPEEDRIYNVWDKAINPLWFQLVNLEVGTIDNNLVSRDDTLPVEFSKCCSYKFYDYTQEERNKLRIEWWEDTIPIRPTWEPTPLIQNSPLTYNETSFTSPPQTKTTNEGVLISFTVKEFVDVAVAIHDNVGKIIRHLAAGVLGENPPEPFQANSLSQQIIWDWKNDEGVIVPPGNYSAKVYLGLTPSYSFAFTKDVPEYEDSDKRGISQSEVAQKVKLGATEPGDSSYHPGGSEYTIFVDRKTEEVYIGGYFIYDGSTGNFIGHASLCELLPWQHQEFRYPELIVGPDNNLWITSYTDLRRYNKNGDKAPFNLLQSHIIPQIRRGNNNPHRGHCFGGPDNDLYIMHFYDIHENYSGVISQISIDGRIKQWGLVEIPAPSECVKVDRQGYIYTACPLYQRGTILIPSDFASVITDDMNNYYKHFYGAIVKFQPEGGEIVNAEGDYLRGVRGGYLRSALLGSEWVHPWISPMLNRGESVQCNCESARFDLDPFERLWIPDAVRSRIEIIDKNANTIKVIGEYGNLEDSNGENIYFGFPMAVSVSDKACYVGDFFYRQGVKLGLSYKQEAHEPIEYIENFTIITPSSLPQIIEGKNVTIMLETINGNSPCTWTIMSGSLPPGISIDPFTGVISGIPTKTGNYSFIIRVQDSISQPCTKEFTMAVTDIPPLTIVTDTLYNATLGQPYHFQLSSEGGITPNTWAIISGSLPDGLKLNAEAGYIFGTPIKLQTCSFEVKIEDSSIPTPNTSSKNFSLTVRQGETGDNISPAAITDFIATSTSSTFTIFSWTAPGDDGSQGQASSYNLRYSSTPLLNSASASEKDTWWNKATEAYGLPNPKAVDSSEEFTLFNLDPSTSYYFAIKAADESGNVSEISNITFTMTQPKPIIDIVKIRAQCDEQGCYNSLSQWQDQYPNRDLVGSNKILWVECYNDWPDGIDDQVTISGWTTDYDHYIKIKAATRDDQTKGIKNSGFRISTTAPYEGSTLNIENPHVKLQGIEIENKGKGPAVGCKFSKNLEIEGCLLEANGIEGSNYPWPVFYQDYQCDYLKIWNTIARQKNKARNCFTIAGYKQKAMIYNVIAEGGAIGFATGEGEAILKNCIAYGNTIGFNSNLHAESTNNASWDDTAPGSSPQIGIGASDFVDADKGDFHIAPNSIRLKDKGVDLSSDPYIPTKIDIDGELRIKEEWDIGADEYNIIIPGAPEAPKNLEILDLENAQ